MDWAKPYKNGASALRRIWQARAVADVLLTNQGRDAALGEVEMSETVGGQTTPGLLDGDVESDRRDDRWSLSLRPFVERARSADDRWNPTTAPPLAARH